MGENRPVGRDIQAPGRERARSPALKVERQHVIPVVSDVACNGDAAPLLLLIEFPPQTMANTHRSQQHDLCGHTGLH